MIVSTSPSLTVVICVHNAHDYAELCIESVLLHTPTPYELILIDDGSQNETANMLDAYSDTYDHIKVIRHETARGYTCAANAGLKASESDYTILLNSDTIVSPDWSTRIIACGESKESIGIVGPLSNAATYQSVPFVFDDTGHWKQNTIPGSITVAQYARSIAEVSLKAYPRVPVANGFCFAVKRAVIDAINYLDEETFPRGYGEENDYCLRASDAGFEIAIADDAYVYHATSQSFGVKAREKLTRQAHHAIRSKYSDERLGEVDKALRNHPVMDQVRERVTQYVYHAKTLNLLSAHPALPLPNQELAFLFLLPDCSAKAGGTQVIIETARGLSRMGAKVKIAAKSKIKDEYDAFFPTDGGLFLYYEKEKELYQAAAEFNVAVATIFHSVEMLKNIISKYPSIMPTYYVQDYEPWFLDEHPDLKIGATNSYELIPHNKLFAISPWVVEVINEKHSLPVHKIHGSLDQDLFFPDFGRDSHKEAITISAMIRPSTPWRSPRTSMHVLQALKERFEDRIEIDIFGCLDGQLVDHKLPTNFEFQNYGILGRHDVASLLRQSDIFLDLSEFQAFGRTALEAMACGAAVVAPKKGGVHDFGQHDHNIIQVDTSDVNACIAAASDLIENDAKRQALQENAIKTGLEYSIQCSTQSFLKLMYKLYAEHASGTNKIAA